MFHYTEQLFFTLLNEKLSELNITYLFCVYNHKKCLYLRWQFKILSDANHCLAMSHTKFFCVCSQSPRWPKACRNGCGRYVHPKIYGWYVAFSVCVRSDHQEATQYD